MLKLYWVTTEDHNEDWFILANSKRQAESYHVEYEGYLPGDATAELVVRARDLPKAISPEPCPRHAQLDDLKLVGEVSGGLAGVPRRATINGQTFVEGSLDAAIVVMYDNTFEARGQGRPNGTLSPPREVQ